MSITATATIAKTATPKMTKVTAGKVGCSCGGSLFCSDGEVIWDYVELEGLNDGEGSNVDGEDEVSEVADEEAVVSEVAVS